MMTKVAKSTKKAKAYSKGAKKTATSTASTPDWFDLLYSSLQEPGRLAQAHMHFHQYSLANRWLAASQLAERGLPVQPINTFKGWKQLNRSVKRNEKALALIMPVPIRVKKKDEESESDEDRQTVQFTRFLLRNFWFALDQTEGEEYTPVAPADKDWSIDAAMDFLEIREVPYIYRSINDSCTEGSATGREISVSELAPYPLFARLRQVAKIVLGHTADEPAKGVPTDIVQRQIEAEGVAYLVGATLQFDGLEDSRARMQIHLMNDGRSRFPEKCAHRVFAAADKLINAGYC